MIAQIANGAGLGANRYPNLECKTLSPVGGSTKCYCINADGTGTASEVALVGSSCVAMSYDLVHAVHFADLNGDGLQDYLWVGEKGEVTAFINEGPKDASQTLDLAQVIWYPAGVIATGVGGRRHEIQFADLNGDGRAEYLWVHANGSVDAWVNSGFSWSGPVGSGKAAVGWLPNGQIAGGIGYPGSTVTFADLNGDGRAEYIAVGGEGQVYCYLNGPDAIDNGPNAAHRVWIDQGVIATGVGGLRNNTVFADIDGDGRADYLDVTRTGSGAVEWWYNQGGPDNGPNAAKVGWWDRGSITGGDGTSGANVMFADISGDGRAEYLEVDPNTSAVTAYYNGCPSS
ncbi:hypothetical protein LTR56_025996 [Elasticomyces elasticus]|nr:hypothetical protein LTR56_025996 [Elasticomyces elasticus]